MTQLRSHCHETVVNEIDKFAVSSFDDKCFLLDNGVSSVASGHYKIGSTFSDTTDRQTSRCFKMFAILRFLHPQFLGNSSHFFSVESTQMVTIFRQSIRTRPFSPVVPPLPLLIWTLSRRITVRQREFVAFCMICSEHYLLHVSCGKIKNYLCVKTNFYSSYIFIGLRIRMVNVWKVVFYPYVKVNAFYFSIVQRSCFQSTSYIG